MGKMKMTRRKVLAGVGAAAMTFGASGMFAKDGVSPEGRKLKIIVAGGHPGDPEYGCGGTVSRFTNLGHEVVLLYLNDGGWPPTPPAVRLRRRRRRARF